MGVGVAEGTSVAGVVNVGLGVRVAMGVGVGVGVGVALGVGLAGAEVITMWLVPPTYAGGGNDNMG